MLMKLECMNAAVAIVAHATWPMDTIRRGKALICIDMDGQEFLAVQHQTGAYTVELTDDDRELVAQLTNKSTVVSSIHGTSKQCQHV